MTEPATTVFTRRVRPGAEAEYERLAREAIAAAERFPGTLSAFGR
jgi:antibiotic biosynthesis monooxygenase (ABM) superfamily enzyme